MKNNVPFKIKFNKHVIEQSLELNQIYNRDESGIFWQSLPQNTQALKQEKMCHNAKLVRTDGQHIFA